MTKTSGRTAVARLNKACERVDLFGDYGDPSGLYQIERSRIINSDLFKPSKTRDYCHPYELLIEDFEAFYGPRLIATEAADRLIKLDLGSSATRRLLVPLSVSFEQLQTAPCPDVVVGGAPRSGRNAGFFSICQCFQKKQKKAIIYT